MDGWKFVHVPNPLSVQVQVAKSKRRGDYMSNGPSVHLSTYEPSLWTFGHLGSWAPGGVGHLEAWALREINTWPLRCVDIGRTFGHLDMSNCTHVQVSTPPSVQMPRLTFGHMDTWTYVCLDIWGLEAWTLGKSKENYRNPFSETCKNLKSININEKQLGGRSNKN